MHWGEEYKTSHNSRQSDLARFLALEGVDIIFGHHPHVLQEIEVITAESRSRNTIVFYSLGNIMGNMGFI
jgi:poly-gamma-glutamate synthesis protein (capsule biosynthesis protein)